MPSATEIVAALGCADRLVGRSEECNFPPEVASLPVVSAARVDTSQMASGDIDDAVRESLLDGRSLYAVDRALLDRLQPDLVITQDLCRVCAVSSDELRDLHELDVAVLALDPRTIEGIEASIHTVADQLGVPAQGARVAAEMHSAIAATRRAVTGRQTPGVLIMEWLDPPFAAGHWVPEMAAAAGGRELLGRAGEASRRVTWDDVRAARPELLVLAPCGFTAERAALDAHAVPDLGCRVVAVHGDAYFSRPAPRVAEGIAQLAHLLHPDAAPDPDLPAIEVRAASRASRA
ncbi:MAG: ABC transporter substrate-binding protein [Gaiellales bacterium]